MEEMRMNSWVDIPENSDFSIYNLPFGIITNNQLTPRVGVAIGDHVVDMLALCKEGFLDVDEKYFDNQYLNDFMSLGREATGKVRLRLQQLLLAENEELKDHIARGKIMLKRSALEMLMPVKVGDYTDFYSSLDHARNVGTMFRGPENALMPNWKHLPVGYHGRASSIVVSPASIKRPMGQLKPNDEEPPVYGASRLFDFELEMAFVTCGETKLGEAISTGEAMKHIWGMVLFNDLSARDIQKWEYVPLGPFLGKNFGSVISPWVVTMDALEQFAVEGYEQTPEVLDYLKTEGNHNYNIDLEVVIRTKEGVETKVAHSNYKYMYWNMCQQLAHHTVNGCNINVGDMYASGTISGPEPHEYGSMLELSWRGSKPIPMEDGSERKFLQDGDTCIIRGFSKDGDIRVGFGECETTVLPANNQ